MQQDGNTPPRTNDNGARTPSRVVWQGGNVARSERERLLGQRGATVWFTGLSGSGKSTIAVALERRLVDGRRLAYRVDGDNLRHGLNRDLGFSPEDRRENVRRTGEVCRTLADAGVIVLASLVSPFRSDRDAVRALHAEWGLPFLEVLVDVPLAIAEARDPKGLYRKARAGEIPDFTGIHQPYERPERPEAVIESDRLAPDAAAGHVLAMLAAHGIVPELSSQRSG